jgi:hypothetical protein
MKTPPLLLVTLALAVAGLAGPGSAQASHHFHEFITLGCKSKPNPYTGDLLIAAHPVFRMGTKAHHKNNLRAMKVSARLIPTTPGLNWTRRWTTNQFSNVRPDAVNYKQIGVFTEYQSITQDWNVQVKLRWHRRGKPDWKYAVTWRFEEGLCGGGGVGM